MEELGNLLGGEGSLLDGLEHLDEAGSGEVVEVAKKVLDGVLGSSDGQRVLNEGLGLLVLAFVDLVVDLLQLLLGTGADVLDKSENSQLFCFSGGPSTS